MTRKILIGNISPDTTEEILREMLAKTVENVVHVEIPQDTKNHRNRGYAVVELANEAAADHAVQVLDGHLLNGRALSISVEHPANKRKWYELGKR
jgi:RNA recognition motif-containing protein